VDRDDFIINVYCLVCEHYQAVTRQQRLRQRGYAPALSDEEVITMEICGEYFGLHREQDLYAYFRTHYRHFFPRLSERTSFTRQAANLWAVKMWIQHRLTRISGQVNDPVQVIDTLPLPVCVYTRSGRDRCFKPEADYGHCAAKKLDFYGFILGLRISRLGMILAYPLLPARPHDSQLLDDLIAGFQGVAPADKGFITRRQRQLAQKRLVELVTPARQNMKIQPPLFVKAICRRWRKLVETVVSHLTERFDIERTRPVTAGIISIV
jgi:hypothetical protein